MDNIVGAEVVTAAGEIVRASETENSDLLWGLRGGGGNFGIVTEFELKLHPLESPLLFGNAIYPLDQARAVLKNYRQFVQTETDETHAVIGLRLCPPFPFVPPEQHFKPVITLAIVYVGDHAEGRLLMQPLLGFGTPLVADAQPLPYLVLQQSLDAASPDGAFYYSKAGYLNDLSDETIDRLVDAAARINSPLTTLELGYLHGAISRVADEATAFSNRQADYIVNLAAGCPDPTMVDATVVWVRQSWANLQEFMTGGVYVNFMSNDEQERIEAAYGSAKYRRLVALKDKYDPHNLFRLNQNIRLSRSA